MNQSDYQFENPAIKKHPKVRWAVIEHLLQQILSQTIRVGDQIPTANELCDTISVSRTVVREGISILVSKGMLTSKPGEGTYVLPLSSWALLDPEVLSWLQQSDLAFSIIEHMVEIRLIIEPDAAALASIRSNMEQVLAMQDALNRMNTAADKRSPESTQGDIDFHSIILEASGNIFLSRLRDLCMASVELIVRLTFENVDSVTDSLDNHKRLFEAIRSRNPALARQETKRLLRKTVEDLKAMNIPVRKDALDYLLSSTDH